MLEVPAWSESVVVNASAGSQFATVTINDEAKTAKEGVTAAYTITVEKEATTPPAGEGNEETNPNTEKVEIGVEKVGIT